MQKQWGLAQMLWFGTAAILLLSGTALHAQISTNNLRIWFNADTGVTVDSSGSNVVRWADQSAYGNDATQVALDASKQPTRVTNALNGHSVLRFGAYPSEADYLSLTNNTINLTSGLTMFIVAKNAVRQNYNGLFRIGPAGTPFNGNSDLEVYWQAGATDAGSGNLFYLVNRTTYPSPFGQVQQNDSLPAVSSYYLFDVTATSGSATMRMNGANTGVSSGNTYVPTVADWASIGVGYGGSGISLNGDIAAIAVYDADLSPEQRSLVANRLADIYGLSIPEPTAMALLGLSGRLLLWRKRGTS